MLKGIPDILSPDLLKILMVMGHSDEIVIADRGFPARAHAQRVVRCDAGIPELLEAILQFMPLDPDVSPAILMGVPPDDKCVPAIWDTYNEMFDKFENRHIKMTTIGTKAEFYERAKNAYAVVTTPEAAPYANVILRKGKA